MPTKLGQNFLEDKKIAEKIIKAADLKPSDFVIEIGPGKGILTAELAKYAKKVIAIEIDKYLVDYLRKKFKGQKNIEIINDDILKINLSKLVPRSTLHDMRYTIVANLPYYITSPIIRLFLETEHPPREMILTVQKEVAERITALPGKMSKLSVSVQYYARPEILFYVDKKSFNPVPKVDSAVIRITYNQQQTTNNKKSENLPLCPPVADREKGYWMRAGEHSRDLKTDKNSKSFGNSGNKKSGENEKFFCIVFFCIVRAGFCARRKTLVNNLSNSLQLDKKEVQEKLKAAGISPTARAQELSVEDWEKLAGLF